MEIVSIGNHTLIRPRYQNDGHINPLIVCGHLDDEKPDLDVEEVGEVRGVVRVPYDETARGYLDYSDENGNAKCERVRLAVLEGTIEELRQLTLGKCRIVMETEAN